MRIRHIHTLVAVIIDSGPTEWDIPSPGVAVQVNGKGRPLTVDQFTVSPPSILSQLKVCSVVILVDVIG